MFYHIEKKDSRLYAYPYYELSPIPHIHTHIEMIYLLKGSSKAYVDNKEYLIESGDVFFAFPHQIHFFNDCSAVSVYLLIFPVDFYKELQDIFLHKIPSSPIIKSNDIRTDVHDCIKKIIKLTRSNTFLDYIAAKGYLLSLLGEMLSLMTLLSSDYNNDAIKNILTYCIQNYTESLTLDILAKELQMSKYYISHIFKKRMNICFTDFINSLRTEHACHLLETNSNITDIAFASGFTSIRTFNRSFKKNMGMSPSGYLQKKLDTKTGANE